MLKNTRTKRSATVAALGAAAMLLAACGSGGSGSDGGTAVTLITKDSVNPFFVAMQQGAKKAAKAEGVDLSLAAGKQDGDEEGQIKAIEDAIANGDKGILITPNGPGVNASIKKARDAGLYVIALDTPPDPADTVDITFATDNFKAGELIGEWTKAQLKGKKATIALLDLFNDKIVSVDYNRDQGFLTGMGIDTKDKKKNGDEDKTGKYDGGDYEIVCNEPAQGSEDGGRTAMETLPVEEQEHQRRLHAQRADRGRCRRRPQAGRRHRGDHLLDRRWLRRRQPGQERPDRRDLAAVPGQDGRARRQGDQEDRRRWRQARGHQGPGLLRHRRLAGDRHPGHRSGLHRHHQGHRALLGQEVVRS